MTHSNVRVRCPDCGVIGDVPSHQIRLYRCTSLADRDFYAWRCPACGQPTTRRADASATCLLTAGGVPSVLYTYPLEMSDRQRLGGPWQPYEDQDVLLDIHNLPTFEGERCAS